jgi:hypothetical protein
VPTPLRLGEISSICGSYLDIKHQASEISISLKHPSWTWEQVVDLVRPFDIFENPQVADLLDSFGLPTVRVDPDVSEAKAMAYTLQR